MRQCIALAGLACLMAAGCAQTGLTRGRQAGYIASSQRAPRPTIMRDYRKPGVELASYNKGCDSTCGAPEQCCGCAVEGCGAGCCTDPGGCGGACQRMVDGIASGGCGCGQGGCGAGGCGCCPMGAMCPGGQTYPEYPAFNPGPTVGQTAYPYYTTHGPRDFLAAHPPSIGPY